MQAKTPPIRRGLMIAALAVLLGGIGSAAMAAGTEKAAADRLRVKLLYSEDDALCKPLAGLYDRLSHEHPPSEDWEDKYADRFRAIGLRQPKPLDDARHPLHVAVPRWAYYRLKFPGERQTRLVFVTDIWFSDQGAFATDLWIFKPSIDVDGRQFFRFGLG